MHSGLVFAIKKYSVHDGPGIRTTVFMKGCPLSCWWCHNPEGQYGVTEIVLHPDQCIGCGRCRQACPQGGSPADEDCQQCGRCTEVCPTEACERIGVSMTTEDLMSEIRKDLVFYDRSGGGVTFSGGEPLMQADFLLEVLGQCQHEEIHCAIETSGWASEAVILQVAEKANLFIYDLKHMDPIKHRSLTGVSNEPILANLKCLAKLGSAIRIRIPIIPGINDDRENIMATGLFVASLPGFHAVDILPYHGAASAKYHRLGLDYRLSGLVTPSDARMEQVADTLRALGLTVKIGG